MTDKRCPSPDDMLVSLAKRDRALEVHLTRCGECEAVLGEFRGVLALLQEVADGETPRVPSSLGDWTLRCAAALILLVGTALLVTQTGPVTDAAGVFLRGDRGAPNLVAIARPTGSGWVFHVRPWPGADRYEIEIWALDESEPIRLSSVKPVIRWVPNSFDSSRAGFWVARAYRDEIVLSVGTPVALPRTPSAQ